MRGVARLSCLHACSWGAAAHKGSQQGDPGPVQRTLEITLEAGMQPLAEVQCCTGASGVVFSVCCLGCSSSSCQGSPPCRGFRCVLSGPGLSFLSGPRLSFLSSHANPRPLMDGCVQWSGRGAPPTLSSVSPILRAACVLYYDA